MATIIGTVFGIFMGLTEGLEEAGVSSGELVKTEVIAWEDFFAKDGDADE
jgi:hypothetical protein